MFAKPMRLEKWIAFDGAVGAEVAEQVAENAFDAGDDGSDGENADIHQENESSDGQDDHEFMLDAAELFAFSSSSNTITGKFDDPNDPTNDYEYSLTVPYGTSGPSSGDPFLPFNNGGSIGLGSGLENDAQSLYFEIENPNNGSFIFLEAGTSTSTDINNFTASDFGLSHGDYIVAKGTHAYLYLYQVQSDGSFALVVAGDYNASRVGTYVQDADGIGFSLFDSNGHSGLSAQDLASVILRSVAFKADSGGASMESFEVNVYYQQTADTHNTGNAATDLNVWNGATDEANRVGVIKDATRPCDQNGNVITGNTNPPIVNPPDVGGGESGGESGSGSSGESGGESSDGDSGDAGGDVTYIHYESTEEMDDDSGEPEPIRRERAEAESTGRDGDTVTVETAAEAAALELMADLEFLLDSVHEDREALAEVLDLLRDEYLARDSEEWGDARDALRELFEAGNGEMNAINRVIAELNRQMDDFHAFAAPRRDGMLLESLRELASSVARRGGETGAITQALSAVARLLASARGDENAAPDAAALRAAFTETYEREMAEWLVRAERLDPMGWELSAAQRNLEQ